MNFQNQKIKEFLENKILLLFLGGVSMAVFAILFVYSFSSMKINLINGGFALFIIILCGLLSTIFGSKFIHSFLNTLESSGF